MDFPKNARVVIVDDDSNEVKDLLSVLAKDGVASLYYDGLAANFPANPLRGIRLMFLDLRLSGLESQEDSNVASTAQNVFAHLVAPDNGPLVLVLWTKHSEQVQAVTEKLNETAKCPLYIVSVDKADCKKGDRFQPPLILTKIQEAISLAEIFGLYTIWENALFEASSKFANEFSALADSKHDWPAIMSHVFYKLYNANTGQLELDDTRQQFLCACPVYADGLVTTLHHVLQTNIPKLSFERSFCFRKDSPVPQNENALVARINAFLFLEKHPSNPSGVGAVYEADSSPNCNDNLTRASIVDDFFPTGKNRATPEQRKIAHDSILLDPSVRLCRIVITPSCDAANKKRMHPFCLETNDKANAPISSDCIVSALLVKHETIEKINYKNTRHERCYMLRNFEFSSDFYDLLIDFGTISFGFGIGNSASPLFFIKPNVLADIQVQASRNLNRIGICSVK